MSLTFFGAAVHPFSGGDDVKSKRLAGRRRRRLPKILSMNECVKWLAHVMERMGNTIFPVTTRRLKHCLQFSTAKY